MLALLACAAVAAVAAASSLAARADPTAGTLSVDNGKGVVMLDLRGAILGRLASGTLKVTDRTPLDRFDPLVVGRKVTQVRIGPRSVLYKGQSLRFRMLGGTTRVVAHGAGIDVSAVGYGTVILDAEPKLVGDEVGVYSLDGVDCSVEPQNCLPLPTDPARFVLGTVGGGSPGASGP